MNPYGLSECGQTHISAAILTFAILFDLRVVGDERRYLGENHRKLAISAGYIGGGGKEKARLDGGPPRIRLYTQAGRRQILESLLFVAAPLTRSLLYKSLERLIQRRLIRETATKRNVGEWKV